MIKKVFYTIAIILYLCILGKDAAYTLMAVFALYELIDISNNLKNKTK